MTIIDPARMVGDLRAIVAAVTPAQIDILTSIQEVINERILELKEEVENDSSNEKEDTSKEEA